MPFYLNKELNIFMWFNEKQNQLVKLSGIIKLILLKKRKNFLNITTCSIIKKKVGGRKV